MALAIVGHPVYRHIAAHQGYLFPSTGSFVELVKARFGCYPQAVLAIWQYGIYLQRGAWRKIFNGICIDVDTAQAR